MTFFRLMCLRLALLVAVEPAFGAVLAVAPRPVPVRAPLSALGSLLGSSLGSGFGGSSEIQIASPLNSGTALPSPVIAEPAAAFEKALAVSRRIAAIRAAEPNKVPALEAGPDSERPDALTTLKRVSAVFADFTPDEIASMPADELSVLAGAVLEQGASDLPGYFAAGQLARKSVAARGLSAEPSGKTYRFETDRAGWLRTVERSALPPGARLKAPEGKVDGYFVDLKVPEGTPVVKDAEGYSIPVPREAEIHVPVRVKDAGKGTPAAGFDLGGLHYKANKAYEGDEELSFLGAGDFGRVFAKAGAAVKLAWMSPMAAIGTLLSDAEVHDADLRLSLALAEAGAGPKVLGSGSVAGKPSWLHEKVWAIFGRKARVGPRLALVKERVRGETVESMIRARSFEPEDRALVMGMLGRLADAGLKPGDLRLSNIMIGTTDSEPARRAYVVDGGAFLRIEPGTSRDDLLLELRELPVHAGFAPAADRMPAEQILKPLGMMLDEGLKRSRAKTLGARLKAAVLAD